MNPYLAAMSQPIQVPPIQPPPIPARRLFQIPDAYGSPTPGNLNTDLPQRSGTATGTTWAVAEQSGNTASQRRLV